MDLLVSLILAGGTIEAATEYPETGGPGAGPGQRASCPSTQFSLVPINSAYGWGEGRQIGEGWTRRDGTLSAVPVCDFPEVVAYNL